MKLAIVSDLHLGYERFHEDAYNQAKEALELASGMADALLIPGDIFDVRAPRPEVLAEGINLFRNLAKKQWNARVTKFEGQFGTYTDLPIMVIPGTHERRADGAENPVSLLDLAGLLVDASEARVTIEKDGEKVAVTGIGGIAEERFGDYLKEKAPAPLAGAFNVLMFHQSLKEILPFGDEILSVNDLPEGFDLYIDGHIHNRIEMKAHGKPFVIPGSTVLTQLKDGEQEEKGFYIYDTKTRSCSFQKIRSRPFVVVKFDAARQRSLKAARFGKAEDQSVIGAHASKAPIIKVELGGAVGSGFKASDIDLSGLGDEYEGRAIVDVSKSDLRTGGDSPLAGLRDGMIEDASIKDLGMGIFLDKLKQNNYDLPISPSVLFEMLSGESKEKATKSVIEELFK